MPPITGRARRTAGALALTALATGCAGAHTPAQVHQRPAGQTAAQHRRSTEMVKAEASDLTIYSTCAEWLATSGDARNEFVGREWPGLGRFRARKVARVQTIGCQAAPGPARSQMAYLQAAVDLVLVKINPVYEELVEEGMHENVETWDRRAFGLKLHRPSPPTLLRSVRERLIKEAG